MEAFGRMITVLVAGGLVVIFFVFSKTVPGHWQKNETIRSLTKEYAERVMESKVISQAEREAFEAELGRFGEYEIALTVFERRRYEGEQGRVYLYAEWEGEQEQKKLLDGSYLRIVVTEKERGNPELFLYGDSFTFFAGGRVS